MKEQALLEINKDRIVAQKKMTEIENSNEVFMSLHCDAIYDIVFEATGSKALASSYRVSRIRSDWKSRQ